MLRRRTLLAASFPALASVGCSKVIEVIVSWNGAIPTFQFRDPSALFGIAHKVAISSFFVSPLPDGSTRPDYMSSVWAFEAAPGSSRELSEVVYARCPVGFTETKPATDLRFLRQYAAVALGSGSAGQVLFLVPGNAA